MSRTADPIIPTDVHSPKTTCVVDNTEERADLLKTKGNLEYKAKDYAKALQHYNDALALLPDNPALYGNRSACYMMLGKYDKALEDARKSVSLDNKFIKGYLRIIKCCVIVGEILEADKNVEAALNLDPRNTYILAEQTNLSAVKSAYSNAKTSYSNKDYRQAVYYLDRAMDIAKSSITFKVMKAECLAMLKRYPEAQEIVNNVLNNYDKKNVDAIFVRGICMYYMDNIDHALNHFQHALKLAPDHNKTMLIYKRAKLLKQKKEMGNEAFKANKLNEAYSHYTDALNVDPVNDSMNSKLFFNRATVSFKLGKLEDSVKDCSSALNLDDKYVKPLLRRAKCYLDLDQYDEAIRDYEKAYQLEKTNEIRNLLNNAKLRQKKFQRKDYYKILGINKNASTEEIKKAYRKRALVHHPDRHANASEGEKKEQEKKFKELGEAYGILSDPNKRVRYDNGQPLDDSFSSVIDPSSMFRAFFENSSGFHFDPRGHEDGGTTYSFFI